MREWALNVTNPRSRRALTFSRNDIAGGSAYKLQSLMETVRVAQLCEYTVEVTLSEHHLEFYVIEKRETSLPHELF